jgi:ubiquitin-conjugating enzyme E2 D/E
MTGRILSIDLENFAKELGSRESGGMQLIDPDKVKQIIQVCFDCSSSMNWNLAGYQLQPGNPEPRRVVIATQFLTTFANRTYGYRVPCLQGLLGFASDLQELRSISPLVPDFEDGIRKINPYGQTHLWDALKKATTDLISFARPNGITKFPNADLRILVISDGEDFGSTAKPLEALQAMITEKIVCDSVVISVRDECKTLSAVSHLTGGLSFRPKSVSEGLQLFEQEALLCYNTRRKTAKFRGTLTEQTIKDWEGRPFDTVAESSIKSTATGKQRIAVPKYVIYQNRTAEIPDARRRRILRELHQAAAIQEMEAVGQDPDGNEVQIYDADIRIFPFSAHLDQWRVYIKGCEGTPYAGKWWYVYVTFPDEYPVRPPIFRFISVPYHMNVSSEGRVCLNAIEKGYQATMPIVEVVQTVKQLFLIPDTTNVLDIAKYFQHRDCESEYNRLAAQSARLYAKDSVEEWIAELSVEQDIPEAFSIEVGEQIPPYLRSAFSGKYIPKERRVVAPGGVIYDREELNNRRTTTDAPICPVTGNSLT